MSALEGVVVDAQWTFESDNCLPTRGEFALRHDGAVVTEWSAASRMILNEIDANGVTYTFENINVNDVVRMKTGLALNIALLGKKVWVSFWLSI